MELSKFKEILKRASSSDDPIEAIKQRLEKEYPETYKEWENDSFNIEHTFITKSGSGTLLGLAYLNDCTNLVNVLRKKRSRCLRDK